jgi:hypothetical protein
MDMETVQDLVKKLRLIAKGFAYEKVTNAQAKSTVPHLNDAIATIEGLMQELAMLQQTSLEYCGECGWNALVPEYGCLSAWTRPDRHLTDARNAAARQTTDMTVATRQARTCAANARRRRTINRRHDAMFCVKATNLLGYFFDYAARGRSRSLEIEIGQRLLFRRPAADGLDAAVDDAEFPWKPE